HALSGLLLVAQTRGPRGEQPAPVERQLRLVIERATLLAQEYRNVLGGELPGNDGSPRVRDGGCGQWVRREGCLQGLQEHGREMCWKNGVSCARDRRAPR